MQNIVGLVRKLLWYDLSKNIDLDKFGSSRGSDMWLGWRYFLEGGVNRVYEGKRGVKVLRVLVQKNEFVID